MTTIEIEECPDSVTALYGEGESAYMELDPDTWTLSCYSIPDDGSTPEGVYFRRRLRWSIPTYQGDSANELMASEDVQRLAETICEGYEDDGYEAGTGRYSEEAEDAIQMMAYAIEQHEGHLCYEQDAAACFAYCEDLDERIQSGEWDSLEDLTDWMLASLDEVEGYVGHDGERPHQVIVTGIEQYARDLWEQHADDAACPCPSRHRKRLGLWPIEATLKDMDMTRKATQLTKLQELSTAQADRVATLEHHVRDILQKMSSYCGGSSVTVDGWTLSYEYLESSVADDGQDLFWIFGEEGASEVVALDAYYLPERPDSHVVFPDRPSLVKFAQLSDKFVAALIEDREEDIGKLDAAIAKVRAAKPAA